MGGFGGTSSGGGGKTKATTTTTTPAVGAVPGTQAAFNSNGLSKEFTGDNAVRMPVYNSLAQQEAARILQSQISARSGRSSTSLVNMPGIGTFASSFLGSMLGASR